MTSNLHRALTGISGILVTPYENAGEVDPRRQRPIVDKAIAAGVHILVANGNTSEFYALAVEEAETMVGASADHVGGRVLLLGRAWAEACVTPAGWLARTSRAAGASALMIHQPPDPFSSPRGLTDYVRAIADAAEGLPIVLYLRNDAIGIKAIRELCELPAVVGVKWATPNPLKLAEAIAATDPHIVWVDGLAESGLRPSMRSAHAALRPASSMSGPSAPSPFIQHSKRATTARPTA
ncbi:dihydrodipicolinate synthase family protein [Rhizobium leguminosarum]|uniref:dihydrodipicolinate synthase family protein n=1 Tax=Rhizobium leguminosarum TaxID=384 RepID=UPI000A875324|nr:dihydrodipicolinate synthase family protein [Rhizobium leguminosarum]